MRGVALAAALAVALSAAGCTASGARASLREEIDAAAAERSLPAPSPFGIDAPGVLHVHTRLSHDSPGPLDEIVAAARLTGNRWVCLTDHTNPLVSSGQPRGIVDGVLIVPGEEITAWGASVFTTGASRAVDKFGADGNKKTFPDYGPEIRSLGGVPIYGHIMDFAYPPKMFVDGLAVYDLSADYRAASLFRASAVLSALSSADPLRSAEAYLLFVQERPVAPLEIWDAYLALGPCVGVAEHDAHGKFRWFGKVYDPYVSLLGLVRNHALVPTLDEASLLEALRRGRIAIGFDAAADLSGARFEAWRGQRPAASMGDAIPFDPSLSLVLHLPVPAEVRVLRDGKPWQSGRGRVFTFPVDGPGVYRAEADLVLAGAARPWGLFNPIRVTEGTVGTP